MTDFPGGGRRLLATALALAFLGTGPAAAEPPAAAAPPPPYQADLLRFAEVLGTVAYLDPLCNGAGAGRWHDKMARLIEAQELGPAARRPYVEAFNRGLRNLAVAHRSCSPRTRQILLRLFAEGAALADRLEFRFGAPAPRPEGAKGLPEN